MGDFPEVLSLNQLFLKLNQFMCDFAAGFPPFHWCADLHKVAQSLTVAVEEDLLIIILLFQTTLAANF